MYFFHRYNYFYRDDAADSEERKLKDLRNTLLAGLMFIQKARGMSNRTLVLLLKFVLLFLNLIADVLVLDQLKAFTRIVPESYDTICSYLELNGNDFTEFAVCGDCDSIYIKSEVTSGRICRCTYVRWPDHSHRLLRMPCNKELHTSRGNVPKAIYCFRPASSYLRDFVQQDDFVDKCNAWRNRNIRPGYMADVYDGNQWKEQENNYLSTRYNLYGILNLDWFQPMDHTPHSVGAIYMVILNLPRAERFKESNVMCLGILPGPHEPKLNANTYLKPIVDDLQSLECGVELADRSVAGKNIYRFRILGCASDLPATRKLGGFLSFHATSGE